MEQPARLTTLYIDFDAFFAHVEKQLDPALHHRPVGITPLPSNYSSLIACCYQAKAAGIHRGMRVRDAREHLPGLVILPARHDVYVRYHHRIIAVVGRFAPVKKVWSIDEVECDIAGMSTAHALALAQDMRAALTIDCGAVLTPSIGLSCSTLLAKIAAEMEKPRGLVMLHPSTLPGRLLDVPLQDVPGIGRRMQARLANAGIVTMPDLWRVSPKQARALWGSVEGERLVLQLHGHQIDRPATKRGMFGHGRVLSSAWRSPDKAGECLQLLTAMAGRRMRRDQFLATRLSVWLKDQDGHKICVERQFPAARDDHTLQDHARQAYRSCLVQAHGTQLQHIHVLLHGLQLEAERREDLFTHHDDRRTTRRNEALSDIIDALNARYGSNTIQLGTARQPPGGYAGTKIAFGRIPSLNDFDRT